ELGLVSRTVQLSPNCVLALYTDGLTEFRRDTATAELALRRGLSKFVGDTWTAHPAAALQSALLAGKPATDDVALLIVQFSNVTEEMLRFDPNVLTKHWRFHSSDAHAAHNSRDELMQFVRRFARPDNDIFGAELVLGEILANTVEHAPGLVEITIDWAGEKPLVTVLDSGPGMARETMELPQDISDENGRGLFLVKALAADLSIRRAPGYGTQICVTLSLARDPIRH
nr:serine/threonine-protein phosphatase [Candidatus Eremiobacteraeota bacterium]